MRLCFVKLCLIASWLKRLCGTGWKCWSLRRTSCCTLPVCTHWTCLTCKTLYVHAVLSKTKCGRKENASKEIDWWPLKYDLAIKSMQNLQESYSLFLPLILWITATALWLKAREETGQGSTHWNSCFRKRWDSFKPFNTAAGPLFKTVWRDCLSHKHSYQAWAVPDPSGILTHAFSWLCRGSLKQNICMWACCLCVCVQRKAVSWLLAV